MASSLILQSQQKLRHQEFNCLLWQARSSPGSAGWPRLLGNLWGPQAVEACFPSCIRHDISLLAASPPLFASKQGHPREVPARRLAAAHGPNRLPPPHRWSRRAAVRLGAVHELHGSALRSEAVVQWECSFSFESVRLCLMAHRRREPRLGPPANCESGDVLPCKARDADGELGH